jgi:hypothetical protein
MSPWQKLHATFSDQTCVFLITDTKTVWAEGASISTHCSNRILIWTYLSAVLSKQQLSRRWSALNTDSASNKLTYREQDSWLDQVLRYLVGTHSPNVMEDLSFDVVESRYSVC